ncbi:N-acetylmuramoyl-L-alanine amidase [Roseibium sp.]|uniref:N-acetylmuramoyl-L-alanine amidase n=1 Tax=Roseibium sp. TaxID=1936156 RepID=UPI003BAFD346
MANPQDYQFDLPSTPRPVPSKISEEWYPGIAAVWKHCTSKRIWDPILGIKTIVIHATAGCNSQGAVAAMNARKASWHWLVPDKDEAEHKKLVWACAPEARAAWHVRNAVSHPRVNRGKTKTNHSSLGINVVNAQKSGDDFSEEQIKETANIVRYCWAKYPNLRHIVSHARLDPLRKSDPGVCFPWSHFKEQVLDTSLFPAISKEAANATPANQLGPDQ